MNHPRAIQIADAVGKPERVASIQRQIERNALAKSFEANRAAIDAALLSRGVAPSGIASPDGCILCGNTIEVRGYDCWACESAFDAPVDDTTALAAKMADVLADILSGVRHD